MNSKISQTFENCKKQKRPALITYTVAGDNTVKKFFKNIECYLKICRYC